MTADRYYFKTAGITVELCSDWPVSQHTFHSKFDLFRTNAPGKDTITLHHHFQQPDYITEALKSAPVLYQQDHWTIRRGDDTWLYQYTPLTSSDPGCKAVGVFSNDHRRTDIYAASLEEKSYQKGRFGALTLFNTDQVLFAKLLCDRGGLIMHANGFVMDGSGFLLAGMSGAGKSTLSGMLKKRGLDILCDDRMFISPLDGQFWIHGNWCHGTEPSVANLSAPLKAIFFLEQAGQNSAVQCHSPTQKNHQLLQSLVKAFMPPEDWERTLSAVGKISKQISCYTLKFDLSGTVFKIIQDIIHSLS